jgi:SAM-dependent methyltransferase
MSETAALGSGPGVITPDGCAVDVYTLLPPGPDPDIVHAAVGDGASILELGSGTGRVTHPLVALGHAVVAVDESPEMLAHVQGAETVLARIEGLDLGERRFDAVLMASHLINVPSDGMRLALLSTCRRYVTDTGCVIIQQWPAAWFDTVTEIEGTTGGGITGRLRDISRSGPALLSGTVEYRAADRLWTQTFTTTRLEEPELAAALSAVGLALDAFLTDDNAWLRAVPLLA